MGKNLNISVLVAARDEYIDQLKCILVPLLIQGFNSIYQDAINISNNKKVIYKFQELLKQIPQWNQTILQEESKRIKKKCPYIMDIVTAIFVTNVKILASVRLKGSKDDIRVKIPTSDIFIHGIYIEGAQQIFYDPFLFYHKNGNSFGKIQENRNHVKQIICHAVDETIRFHLPFDDILQKYLSDALNGNAEHSDSDSESGEDPVSDSDEESIGNEDFPSDEDSEPEDTPVKSFNLGDSPELPKQDYLFSKEDESDDSEPDIDEPPKPNYDIPPEHQFIPTSPTEHSYRPPVSPPEQPFRPPVSQPEHSYRPPVSQPEQPFRPPVSQPEHSYQPPEQPYRQPEQSHENNKYSFFS